MGQSTLESPFHLLAEPARRCIFFSRWEAMSFSRREVTVEHLLLGILREAPALVPTQARDAVVRAIEATEPAGRNGLSRQDPHARSHWLRWLFRPAPPVAELAPDALQVVAAATEGAQAAGRREVMPADLAAEILRAEDTLAGRLLRQYGHS